MSKNYPISKKIGYQIYYHRKKLGMPISLISKEIGISPQQQSRYERGVNRITLDRLFQYATYFEIDIKTFFQSHDF
ncbi:helix-turn-helix domain-containing protein [Providencia hangzhouensis]|uniref:Helix-turn-helix domain n=3 Tax=Providencia TaxID=586 RepID=A0A9N8D404_PRORE|nr:MULTISPECIES: helix-turn-helix transcriptional regulator [Providencia]MBN7840252.1 helix-turn-helix transcriptional regulator [Providencia rettgeri]MBN7852933.1 helix-turn-helix transcriptional regulator [Providencia rettgeri]MBN7861027.1 helix-turn-helix transcriptional regulator [Providencia rettgeri]MBN7871469.1 helix-turn-helix transcriptional regulator [Providencia rettgeri]MBN7898802.1 helix-turn-helix transcriptional regulator [Providencia rettgeri]